MTRLEANKEILKHLNDYLISNPEQRFTQALFNLNINQFSEESCLPISEQNNKKGSKFTFKDNHSEESVKTLEKLKDYIKYIKLNEQI